MKKIVLTLLIAGLAAAGALWAPAQAADNEACLNDALAEASAFFTACGGVSADGTGYAYVDGAEGNQDPLDGFISAANDGSQDEDGVCASAQGDPGEEHDENGVAIEDDDETPACNEALPQAVVNEVAGQAGA